MKPETTISIAKDFSSYPGGRYKTHGPYTGEGFREELLIPALKEYSKVIVNFDGGRGYNSSFLEEAFGGLIRKHNFTYQELKERLIIDCNLPSIKLEIDQYIKEAQEQTMLQNA